uniref:Uncharacterized protein n=1 Tax=Mus musculus TaxID=10090 RepID=Q3UY60_MOUSE|nr:unnamed protein product [Mus musculus]
MLSMSSFYIFYILIKIQVYHLPLPFPPSSPSHAPTLKLTASTYRLHSNYVLYFHLILNTSPFSHASHCLENVLSVVLCSFITSQPEAPTEWRLCGVFKILSVYF